MADKQDETAYLLSTQANRDHLAKSEAEYNLGKVVHIQDWGDVSIVPVEDAKKAMLAYVRGELGDKFPFKKVIAPSVESLKMLKKK